MCRAASARSACCSATHRECRVPSCGVAGPGNGIFGSLASTAASSVTPERLQRLLGQEYVGFPSGDLALVIDAGAIVEQDRRALRIPAVLVLRASIAAAPAGRSPWRSTLLRKSSRRRRCGHSSPRLRRRCSARAPASSCSMVASCGRSRWLACEGVQTVRRPSLKSATAQDGPIDPCVFIAKS